MAPVVIGDDKRSEPKPERAQHDSDVYGAVYMNDLARLMRFSESKTTYPVGAAIVREKLLTATSETPEVVAAMLKREKGFNPAANDWEFIIFNADLTKIKQRQKTGACQRCHASITYQDFVFRDPTGFFIIPQ